MEPTEFWENSHTKRRIHNLLSVSGLAEQLVPIKARVASEKEVTRFHTQRYHDQIQQDSLRNGGDGGELAPFSRGGYGIACLSAGGVLAATEAVLEGKVENAYCLVRPPGHHAEADRGRGFCIFNNVAIAALHARTLGPTAQRIAIVDYGKYINYCLIGDQTLTDPFSALQMSTMATAPKRPFGTILTVCSYLCTKIATTHKTAACTRKLEARTLREAPSMCPFLLVVAPAAMHTPFSASSSPHWSASNRI